MKWTMKYVAMALAMTPVLLAQTPQDNSNQYGPAIAVQNNTSPASSWAKPDTFRPTYASFRPIVQNGLYQTVSQDRISVESQPVLLRDGTSVRLRLTRTLSSENVKTGEQIDFDVLDDVFAGDRVVIARGTKAMGSITEAEPKRRMGRGGKLNFVLDYVRLEDGTKVALRAERETKGGGHVGAMSAGMVASIALGFGLPAPLFLLMHGKDAVVPAGSELTAYVNGDSRIASSVNVAAR